MLYDTQRNAFSWCLLCAMRFPICVIPHILADRTLWIPAFAGMTDGGMGGPIHPSNMTTRRVGSRPELEDERLWRSVGRFGWTVVAAHTRSGRVDYRHGVAVVVVRVRLLVLLAEQSSGIVLIDAFDANACGRSDRTPCRGGPAGCCEPSRRLDGKWSACPRGRLLLSRASPR